MVAVAYLIGGLIDPLSAGLSVVVGTMLLRWLGLGPTIAAAAVLITATHFGLAILLFEMRPDVGVSTTLLTSVGSIVTGWALLAWMHRRDVARGLDRDSRRGAIPDKLAS